MGTAGTHAQKADLKVLSTCWSRLSTKDLMQVVCPPTFSMDIRSNEQGVLRSEASEIRWVALLFTG